MNNQDRVEYVLHILSEDPVLPRPEFKQALVHTLQARLVQEQPSPWRNLFKPWGWRLAFVSMIVCALLALLLLRLPHRAMLTVQQGTVHVVSASSSLMPWGRSEDHRTLEDGRDVSISEGGNIILAEDSAAVLSLFNDSLVELVAGTHITLTKAQPRSVLQGAVVEINMQSGALRAQVRPLRASSEHFEVATPAARVLARRTVFRTYILAPDHTYVAVDEGGVTVVLNDVTLGYPTVQVPEGYEVHAVVGQALRVLPQASPQGADAHSSSPQAQGGWHNEVAAREVTPSLAPSIMPEPTQAPFSNGAGGHTTQTPGTESSLPVPMLSVTPEAALDPTVTPLLPVTRTPVVTGSPPQPEITPVVSATPPALFASADLMLMPVVMPNPTAAGRRLFYKLTVKNGGSVDADKVIVTETLPAEVELVTSTASFSETLGQAVVWRLGRLSAGERRTLQLEVRVASWVTQSFTHTAVARGTTPEGVPLEDRAVLQSVVSAASDVALSRVSAPTQVAVGQVMTYTLSYVNFGPATAQQMTVTALLPPDVQFGGVARATHPLKLVLPPESPKPGTVLLGELAGPIWLAPQLKSGAWGQIVFTVTVSPSAAGVLPATFSIDSASLDVNKSNDTRVTQTTALHKAELSVTVSDAPSEVLAGARIKYAFRYANYGPGDAEDVVLTHTLPVGVRVGEIHPSSTVGMLQITQTGRTLVGTMPHLPAGASGVFVVSATVGADAPPLLRGRLSMRSAAWEDDLLDNVAQQRIRVLVPALEMESTLSAARLAPHVPLSYTVHVTNTGTMTFASGAVRVAATLPPGTSLLTKSVGMLPSSLGYNQRPLAPGQSFHTAVVLRMATPRVYPLNAAATGRVPGRVLTAADRVTVSVLAPAVALAQSVSYEGDIPGTGTYVTVTVDVANTGPSVLDKISLRNVYHPAMVSLVSVEPLPDVWEDGLLGWSDLTAAAPEGMGRNLAVGETFAMTMIFRVLELPTPYSIPQNYVTVMQLVDVHGNGGGGALSDSVSLFSRLYLPFVTRW